MFARAVLGGMLGLLVVPAMAEMVYDIPIALAESMDLEGDPDNVVLMVDVASELGLVAGTPLVVNGVGWDISLATNSPSTLAEAKIYLDDNINPDGTGVYLNPGVNDSFPGNNEYDSGGIIVLGDVGIPDVPLPNGMLRVEFFEESKDDFPDFADAFWRNGFISVQVVPEPGACILLLILGSQMLRRR